ncbi:hypothetical protein WJX72_001556 [[Myrmecia] bisecta]|uniref:Uncharacterized protein n=1 Tax=[Myrmecia] bisecta TaxID=41462 RepID=A0AAW1Q2V6_9CHLO
MAYNPNTGLTDITADTVYTSSLTAQFGSISTLTVGTLISPALSTVAYTNAYSDLTGLPVLFGGTYSALAGLPTLFSGAYGSLSGLPTLGSLASQNSLAYGSLTGLPTLGSLASQNSISYASVTGTPTLAPVATTGSYGSLYGLPTLGSLASQNTVSYASVTGTPTLGSLSSQNSLAFASLTGLPTLAVAVDWNASASSNGTLSVQNKPTVANYTSTISSGTVLGIINAFTNLSQLTGAAFDLADALFQLKSAGGKTMMEALRDGAINFASDKAAEFNGFQSLNGDGAELACQNAAGSITSSLKLNGEKALIEALESLEVNYITAGTVTLKGPQGTLGGPAMTAPNIAAGTFLCSTVSGTVTTYAPLQADWTNAASLTNGYICNRPPLLASGATLTAASLALTGTPSLQSATLTASLTSYTGLSAGTSLYIRTKGTATDTVFQAAGTVTVAGTVVGTQTQIFRISGLGNTVCPGTVSATAGAFTSASITVLTAGTVSATQVTASTLSVGMLSGGLTLASGALFGTVTAQTAITAGTSLNLSVLNTLTAIAFVSAGTYGSVLTAGTIVSTVTAATVLQNFAVSGQGNATYGSFTSLLLATLTGTVLTAPYGSFAGSITTSALTATSISCTGFLKGVYGSFSGVDPNTNRSMSLICAGSQNALVIGSTSANLASGVVSFNVAAAGTFCGLSVFGQNQYQICAAANGNVGIQTQTPAYTLDTAGTAQFQVGNAVPVILQSASTLSGVYFSDINKGLVYSGANGTVPTYFAGSKPSDGVVRLG